MLKLASILFSLVIFNSGVLANNQKAKAFVVAEGHCEIEIAGYYSFSESITDDQPKKCNYRKAIRAAKKLARREGYRARHCEVISEYPKKEFYNQYDYKKSCIGIIYCDY